MIICTKILIHRWMMHIFLDTNLYESRQLQANFNLFSYLVQYNDNSFTTVQYNTSSCIWIWFPPPPTPPVPYFFCSILFMSKGSEIMEGFWCSRCLKDHIDVPDIIGSFSGGATTPLVVKSWTKPSWLKVRIFAQLW